MWFTESAKVHADCFGRREFEAISIGPDREFIETYRTFGPSLPPRNPCVYFNYVAVISRNP